jgi:Domain of unknown function (DUF4124)
MRYCRYSPFIRIAMLLCLCAPSAYAQIFTCTDASGRKITSDRPIPECLSKDQKELNASGTVKRLIKPEMTAEERRLADQKLKAEIEERNRLDEQRRRNRALLSRYPNKAAHDSQRNNALTQVDEVIQAAQKRIGDLTDQRKGLLAEMEFYKKDPSKAPTALRRQMEDNDKNMAAQKRFINDQGEEKKRINAGFDEELERLTKLWAQAAAPTTGSTSSSLPAKK